ADPRDGRVVHDIEVLPGTLLADMLKLSCTKVNSWHGQSIFKDKLGEGLRISAISPKDDEVEAVEGIDDKFCVGIQFHPEFLLKGDVSDGYLPAEEIANQLQIFAKMAQVAKNNSEEKKSYCSLSKASMTGFSFAEGKERFLATHRSRTENLINRHNGYGKLQLR
ncbi:MAG TPA: gamma-glutamyl-gamma-aminobutyrate hydrolase family protein, partial [Coxiellaceae bacterium]|nr:gamma-glutamyl-gamma-aminobutyrate hydrolase family protein [Coxiellaceae bacterium]